MVFGFAIVPRARQAFGRPHDLGLATGISLSGRVAALLVFVVAAVLLLSFSGVFHLMTPGPAREVLKRLDHAAIFVLIAGTFTPIHAILFKGPWRWGMLAFIWTCATAGVTLKSIYFEQTPAALGLTLYVLMGWFGGFSVIMLAKRYSFRFAFPIFLGGVLYTVGALIELVDPTPLLPGVVRSHEVFHAFVLAGLAAHAWFAWRIAGGWRHGSSAANRELDEVVDPRAVGVEAS